MPETKYRTLLRPGYRTYTGKVLTEIDCEIYNRIQKEINWHIDNSITPHSFLLDHSARTFRILSGELTK